MIDVFTKVVLAGACLFTFAWVILAQRRTIKRLSDAYLRLTHFQRVLVALAVIVCTVYAQKPSTNDVNGVSGTNDVEIVIGGDTNDVEIVEGGTNGVDVVEGGDTNGVEIVEGGETNGVDGTSGEAMSPSLLLGFVRPLTSGQESASPFAAPYRLESVLTNEDYSYAMPADGAIRGTWHLTGAYEDVQKVTLDGFSFPLGSDLCTSLWAYTWGKVRPQLKNVSNEIAAVGAPMSAIPDVSRFWSAATSNDTYLLTWENFAVGRQSLTTNNQQLTTLSAQLELWRNGNFITRSNDVECVYHRVNPDDIDDDGIPNEEDPEPIVPADETQFGPHQTLPTGSDTNYYYWVDLVVGPANARVVFEGDGESNWPDPSFVAKAGETNRVYLLIGKTYGVRCPMPIQCVDREDDDVEVYPDGDGLLICWDIRMEFVSERPLLMARPLLGAGSGSGGTGVRIIPGRAGGGSFSWPGSFCCYNFAADGSPVFNCQGNCGCGGYCNTGNIIYTYVGYSRDFDGWSCSCHSPGEDDDPHGGDDDPDDPPATASVSVSFSEGAILFENNYTNSYGRAVYGQTTVATLNCRVYGGDHGGIFSLSFDSGGCLNRISGDMMPCEGIEVEAGAVLDLETDFNGKVAGNVVTHALFVENDTSRNITGAASLPVVEIKTKTESTWNQWQQRKELGVGEKVRLLVSPSDATSNLSISGCQMEDDIWYYNAPHHAANQSVVIGSGDVQLAVVFQTLEPSEIRVASHWGFSNTVAGVAGNFEGHFSLCVMPTNVPFCEIEIAEIGMVATDPLGCFRLPAYAGWLDHSLHGGDSWHGLNRGNTFFDSVTFPLMREWGDGGSFTWPIPNRWRVGNSGAEYDLGSYNQRFEVDFDGTSRISKFGYTFQQTTNLLFTVTGGAQ